MPDIRIEPVTTSAQKKQFFNLPWQLYKGDPYWIPPLRGNNKELLGFKKHPFYEQAEAQAFIAYEDGQPCGRVLAVVNHAHNKQHDDKLGFAGFYESTDNQEVADGLFAAAGSWLKEHGMEQVRGPANPSQNYECGLLVEGFDAAPTFMMTYNPPYYQALWENAGFEKSHDMYAYNAYIEMLADMDTKLRFIVQECKRRFELNVRRLDKRKFLKDVHTFLDIYNKSMDGSWGFVPLSDNELAHMAAGMKHLVVPEMTTIAEIDGKPIGAVFGMLDYNPLIKEIDGSLFPFGFLKLLWKRKALTRVRMISTNVLPEWQKWGVGLVLLGRLVPESLEWGIKEGEFSWVLESNKLSRGSLERGGAKRTRTYRMYDRPLD